MFSESNQYISVKKVKKSKISKVIDKKGEESALNRAFLHMDLSLKVSFENVEKDTLAKRFQR